MNQLVDFPKDGAREIGGAVLAAGLGTRLRPMTNLLPKPLVPVAGRPLIDYAFDALKSVGIEKIGVNAYHLKEEIEAGIAHRMEDITVVTERELLGTGGGIKGIADVIGTETLLVINGDALFDFELKPLIEAHRMSGALGTLALRWVPPNAPFGRVGMDAERRLWQIAEVSARGPHPDQLRFGAFTGVQILERELIDRIPDEPCDILRTAYRGVMEHNGAVYGHFVNRDSIWLDVGTPERYLDAHRVILNDQFRADHLPPLATDNCRIGRSVCIHPSARLNGPSVIMDEAVIDANVTIGPNVFIDKRAHIKSGCHLENCIIWPDARVEQSVNSEVVFPLS